MKSAALSLAALALLLGGCAGSSKPAPARPTAAAQPRSTVVRVPEVMAPKGLEGVIGASAEALLKRFGTPRIDLVEGDARKLQFAGAKCVLDIFIYPCVDGSPLARVFLHCAGWSWRPCVRPVCAALYGRWP